MDKIRDIKNAAPGSMRERAQWRRNVLGMANGDAPLSSPFSGTGDGGSADGDSPMPSPSAPNPNVPTQPGGAGGASPLPTDAQTETIPIDAPTEPIPVGAPTGQIPADTQGQQAPVLTEQSAFNQVREGMMADFTNNQHMSQEEAEQAFQEAVSSGEVDNSVQAYMRQNNQSSNENVTAQPEADANQPVYNTETGEVVGETLPSGTMDAAVSAASTWQNATGNTTPMPESVNDALQQAHMRENPVQQSPEEHLRMAQEEWTRTTGLPGDMMPASAERAMNPNGIQPSREFTVDSGQTQQQSQPQPQAQVRQQPSVRMQPPATPSPTVKPPVDANPSNLTGFPVVGNLRMKKPPTGGQPTSKPPFMK